METSTHGITAPAAVYEIDGRRFEIGSRGFTEAVADAHAAHERPRCMCLVEGIEMYVARLAGSNGGYIVKRMPDTGSHHAPDCPSYEPPANLSGLGQVLGNAITEDPATGETTLKLDFPLSRIPGRSTMPASGSYSDSVKSDGIRLSLRGLLHYLWDQAELTHWQPGFAGKRSWTTVRRHLLRAAEHKFARGHALQSRLYIPEVFSVEHRHAINERRLAQWAHAVASPGKPQPLMLMVGEVKEIVPARYGFKAVVKHVPDLAFAIDEQLFRRLGRRFESELSIWGASDSLHMVIIATFGLSAAGIPTIAELSLMPVTCHWLPVEDAFELKLIETLARDGRSFVKALRYNLLPEHGMSAAVLTDAADSPVALYVVPVGSCDEQPESVRSDAGCAGTTRTWQWHVDREPMPALPPKAGRSRHAPEQQC